MLANKPDYSLECACDASLQLRYSCTARVAMMTRLGLLQYCGVVYYVFWHQKIGSAGRWEPNASATQAYHCKLLCLASFEIHRCSRIKLSCLQFELHESLWQQLLLKQFWARTSYYPKLMHRFTCTMSTAIQHQYSEDFSGLNPILNEME